MNSNFSRIQAVDALILGCFGFLENPNLGLAGTTDPTDSSIPGFVHMANSDDLSDADTAYAKALREHLACLRLSLSQIL